MDIRSRAHAIYDEMISWRRDFHAHPELSNNEFRTTEKIRGFEPRLSLFLFKSQDSFLILFYF